MGNAFGWQGSEPQEEDEKDWRMNIIDIGYPAPAKEVAMGLIDLYSPRNLDYHEALAIILAVAKLTSGKNINLDKVDTKRLCKWSIYSKVYRNCGIIKDYRTEIALSPELKKSLVIEDGIVIESKSSLVNLYDVVKDDKIIQYRNIPTEFDYFDPEFVFLGTDSSKFDKSKQGVMPQSIEKLLQHEQKGDEMQEVVPTNYEDFVEKQHSDERLIVQLDSYKQFSEFIRLDPSIQGKKYSNVKLSVKYVRMNGDGSLDKDHKRHYGGNSTAIDPEFVDSAHHNVYPFITVCTVGTVRFVTFGQLSAKAKNNIIKDGKNWSRYGLLDILQNCPLTAYVYVLVDIAYVGGNVDSDYWELQINRENCKKIAIYGKDINQVLRLPHLTPCLSKEDWTDVCVIIVPKGEKFNQYLQLDRRNVFQNVMYVGTPHLVNKCPIKFGDRVMKMINCKEFFEAAISRTPVAFKGYSQERTQYDPKKKNSTK